MGSGESIAERIRGAIERDEIVLPPMPELALRMQKMFRNVEDLDLGAAEPLLRSEPAVVAALLRMANSAAFGGLRQISDLRQAMARLGVKRVAALVTTILHRDQFSAEGGTFGEVLDELWHHSLASAMAARRLAVDSGEDGEEAFIAGLLHDVGKLLVLKAASELAVAEQEVTEDLLAELMSVLHPDVGYRTLKSWNLPDAVCDAARGRHEEEGAPLSRLLLCVQAADMVASKLRACPELDLLAQPPFVELQLDDVRIAEMLVDLEDEIAEVQSLL